MDWLLFEIDDDLTYLNSRVTGGQPELTPQSHRLG
jgi:hypothetical protein